MADTAITITQGTGTNVDTRTESTNGNHRQVVVLGDPSTNAGVAPVDVANGLYVHVTNLGQATMASSIPVVIASNQPEITIITLIHKMVHDGRMFSGGRYESSIGNGLTLDILIQLNTHTFDMEIDAVLGGDGTIQIFEGTTFSAAGTAVTMSNHLRSSIKVFDGTVTYGPTIISTGTPINGERFIAGGQRNSSQGGTFSGFGDEFTLSASTNYLIRMTNYSNASQKGSIGISGYQETL